MTSHGSKPFGCVSPEVDLIRIFCCRVISIQQPLQSLVLQSEPTIHTQNEYEEWRICCNAWFVLDVTNSRHIRAYKKSDIELPPKIQLVSFLPLPHINDVINESKKISLSEVCHHLFHLFPHFELQVSHRMMQLSPRSPILNPRPPIHFNIRFCFCIKNLETTSCPMGSTVQTGGSWNGEKLLWTGRWHLMCCEEHNILCIWSDLLSVPSHPQPL